MTEPNFLSIQDAIQQQESGKLTSQALVEACSKQIERLNPELNAFVTIERKEGSARKANTPLRGIPLAVKDLYETRGIRTTAGSLFFKDYTPTEDAAAVRKVLDAGAVILGKTNTHEIALGVTTINPHFGTTRNPWDTSRIPGGSSGGSAVAVATGMALAALGTDTGGSIRIPASLCGVVGLKPTYGRVSVRGVIPLSWNLDHAGPLVRSVYDAAIMLQVLAGYDPEDVYSIDRPVDDYLAHIAEGVKGSRIAAATGAFFEESDPEVDEAVSQAARVFEKLGAKVEKVDLSFLREAALANSLMTPADGAAFHKERLESHPELFGEDVRQRLETGRTTTSTEYSLARKTQSEMKHRLARMFQDYEFLLLPTTQITAPKIEGSDAIGQARRLTRFTAPFNLTGLPAISIPCGFNKEGMPIGLQLVARAWDEATLLKAGYAYERETEWGKKLPGIVKG